MTEIVVILNALRAGCAITVFTDTEGTGPSTRANLNLGDPAHV